MTDIIRKIADKISATQKTNMQPENIEKIAVEGDDFRCYMAEKGNVKCLIFYYEDGTMNILYL